MPGQIARGEGPAGLAAEFVDEACALLMRGDPAGVEEAGSRFQQAIKVLAGSPGRSAAEDLKRRTELHKSVRRASRLMAAQGRWIEHRRSVLFPDEGIAPCYGANGRQLETAAAGSTTLQG